MANCPKKENMLSFREMQKRTFIAAASALLLVLCAGKLSPEGLLVGHASAATTSQTLDQAVSMMALFSSFLITALNVMAWVLFMILDSLLSPSLIFDLHNGSSTLIATLNQIWVFSRDMVNVGFAFVLIVGAVYTVVTGSTEKLKSMAPKFVIALILVNFSWFVPRVLFDVANVLTYTVYQIPSAFGTDTCMISEKIGDNPDGTPIIMMEPCSVVNDIKFFQDTNAITNNTQSASGGIWRCLPALVCVDFVDYDPTSSKQPPSRRILSSLVVNFAQLRNLASPSTTITPASTKFTDVVAFLVQLIVVLLIHIALFFPLLAISFALLMRIPILWITMAFMPFVALSPFLPSGMKGETDPMKIVNVFLTSVFLPTMIAVPFAIGFVMLRAGMQVDPSTIPALGGLARINMPLFAGMSSVWMLFWEFMALAVMWIGVFTVLKKQQITAGITEKIKGAGQSLGSFALKAPLGVPIIPMPKSMGESKSAMELLKIPGQVRRGFEATGRLELPGAAKGPPQTPQEQHVTQLMQRADVNLNQRVRGKVDVVLDGKRSDAERRAAVTETARFVKEHFAADRDVQGMTDDAVVRGVAGGMPADIRNRLINALDQLQQKASAPPPPPAPPPAAPATGGATP